MLCILWDCPLLSAGDCLLRAGDRCAGCCVWHRALARGKEMQRRCQASTGCGCWCTLDGWYFGICVAKFQP